MGLKKLLAGLVLLLASCEGSIFWEKMMSFFATTTTSKFQEVVAWQIAGLFIPLVAGPMRVVANILWNQA